MRISQLAAATGTAADTIRYYERQGLLQPPARRANNYRDYGRQHQQRLVFIRRARSLDMSLDEIRSLLHWQDQPGADCAAVDVLVDEHIGHISTRIRELQALEEQLRALRARCHQASDTANCGILMGLNQDEAAPVTNRPSGSHRHIAGAHGPF